MVALIEVPEGVSQTSIPNLAMTMRSNLNLKSFRMGTYLVFFYLVVQYGGPY